MQGRSGPEHETGVPGANPHNHKENMKLPHRKTPGSDWGLNPGPFWEVTVLTTKLSCFLKLLLEPPYGNPDLILASTLKLHGMFNFL